MDCNNIKGRHRTVDPVRKDPRAYLNFDLGTGRPIVVAGRQGCEDAIEAMLDAETPHRAILRELILEEDDALNPHRACVTRAIGLMPRLFEWAADPVAA
jgi:hypothetical protein